MASNSVPGGKVWSLDRGFEYSLCSTPIECEIIIRGLTLILEAILGQCKRCPQSYIAIFASKIREFRSLIKHPFCVNITLNLCDLLWLGMRFCAQIMTEAC